MGGFHVHRCRDADPQCGHDVVLCEKHDTALLIADLDSRLAAMTKDRDAHAEAVRVLGEAYRLRKRATMLNRESGIVVGVKVDQSACKMATDMVNANPIASAAVKGENHGKA